MSIDLRDVPQDAEVKPESVSLDVVRLAPTNPYVPFPREDVEISVNDRFERCVRMHRDREALRTTTESLTYEQLNRLSNRVARALCDGSSSLADPVCVIASHGVVSIVGFLAVLKAGKIFVPIDPSWPDERLARVVSETGGLLIVSDRANKARLESLIRNARILTIEGVEPDVPTGDLALEVKSESTAAIYFTSSSTGRPKAWSTRTAIFCTVHFATPTVAIFRAPIALRWLRLLPSPRRSPTSSALCSMGDACFPIRLKTKGCKSCRCGSSARKPQSIIQYRLSFDAL